MHRGTAGAELHGEGPSARAARRWSTVTRIWSWASGWVLHQVGASDAGRSGDPLVQDPFSLPQFALDRFREVRVVDEDAELDVIGLRAPGEVCAGHQEKVVIDGQELGMVADIRAVELLGAPDLGGARWAATCSVVGDRFCPLSSAARVSM